MKIKVHSKYLKQSTCALPESPRVWVLLFIAFLVSAALASFTGYRLGLAGASQESDELTREWQVNLEQQQRELSRLQQAAQDSANALARRLGQMQAQVIRLEALGQRLVKMAHLDSGEFDFENPPAQGGPASMASQNAIGTPDLLAALERLSRQLEDRSSQLQVLEGVLMNRGLQAEVLPEGRPIVQGWLSSRYGMRTDPFTGKRDFHAGIDFAGKEGSAVVATAAGVVTWAGTRSGYGKLVEINHGSGYATRYGHNRKILVKIGDTVKKGQIIGEMGSTGRSTGPHVHFEVLINGRTVNPAKYIQAAR